VKEKKVSIFFRYDRLLDVLDCIYFALVMLLSNILTALLRIYYREDSTVVSDLASPVMKGYYGDSTNLNTELYRSDHIFH
jgi:hypothetical protein